MTELLQALANDNLVAIKKILSDNDFDLSQDIETDYGYDLEDSEEVNILFYALQIGASIEAIELLIEDGAKLSYTNAAGVGVLDVAIKHKRKDIVALCLDNGLDPSASSRKSGITPLILAASFNNVDMVKYLVSRGASIEERDGSGYTALDYALKMNQKEILKYIKSLDE